MSDNSKKPAEQKAIQKLLIIAALVFVQIPQVVSAWIDIAQWSLLLLRRDSAPARTIPERTEPKGIEEFCVAAPGSS
ncbi:MAG: hypothetical protein F6J93_11330 [Oscillatoria sp. SIO1A7]|nr:hypothetical protein [Oscillatoria sp. SIO1A7]